MSYVLLLFFPRARLECHFRLARPDNRWPLAGPAQDQILAPPPIVLSRFYAEITGSDIDFGRR